MNSFMTLFLGELHRMKRYHILGASFLVVLVWGGVLHFVSMEDVTRLFPLLIFLDVTSMAMLLVGVTMFFEKQEGTLKTLLVSPISKTQYILAKTLANILSNLLTFILLYVYAILFKEIHLNPLGILAGLILVSFFHSLFGFLLTYYSKDFTELLMGVMKYAFLLTIPVILVEFGIMKGQGVEKILYALPTKASMVLLNASAGVGEVWEIFLSIGYLVAISLLTYLVVLKKFDEFAIKESGV